MLRIWSWDSLKIGANDIEQLLGGLAVECLRMLIGIHQMGSNVVLDHLRHQPGHGSARPGDQMHDLIATGLIVERTLDTFDLSSNATHPGEKFLLLRDCV